MKDLKELLGISYPIVQAPMLGVTTPGMVAAIANAGGLGSLPLGGLSPEKCKALIRETKAKTNRPFSVNLFAHALPAEVSEGHINKMETYLEAFHTKYNIPFERKPISSYHFYNHLDQISVVLEERIRIVTFTFGLPHTDVVSKLKERGIKIMGTATSVKEAALVEKAGMDAIVAQGIEAGGHRGSFIEDEPLPQVGLISLVPQVVDTVSVPVIAAGGIFDHRTVKAVFTLGASGAQLGSYFLAAEESAASEIYKKSVLSATDTSTKLTQAFTGKWARGIGNGFMEDMKNSGLTIPYYTYQNSLTAALRSFGKSAGIADVNSLWAGQSASKSRRGSTEVLFDDLIDRIKADSNPIF